MEIDLPKDQLLARVDSGYCATKLRFNYVLFSIAEKTSLQTGLVTFSKKVTRK